MLLPWQLKKAASSSFQWFPFSESFFDFSSFFFVDAVQSLVHSFVHLFRPLMFDYDKRNAINFNFFCKLKGLFQFQRSFGNVLVIVKWFCLLLLFYYCCWEAIKFIIDPASYQAGLWLVLASKKCSTIAFILFMPFFFAVNVLHMLQWIMLKEGWKILFCFILAFLNNYDGSEI